MTRYLLAFLIAFLLGSGIFQEGRDSETIVQPGEDPVLSGRSGTGPPPKTCPPWCDPPPPGEE